jgi:hypothetical protein
MLDSEKETENIKRLENIDTKDMTPYEYTIHVQKIKDAYWRRRRAWEREQDLPPSTI